MTKQLDEALGKLTPIQRSAAEWNEGAALVLAGPGAGKTQVLTTRIARLLRDSKGKNFRVLALTFTTKAAKEMRERVEGFVEDLSERTFIGTFHSFAAEMIRQHGSHIGIRPDFGIYERADQIEVLSDALKRAGENGEDVTQDDVRYLDIIDRLRQRLVTPEKTLTQYQRPDAQKVARVYKLYEDAMRQENVLDFNGLILEACRLAVKVPGVAERVRKIYPYWLVDEFQDTSLAQFRLLTFISEGKFGNVFAVADDDQIIYQWAGASYQRIEDFRAGFKPELIQLVDNHRCPPEVVRRGNMLVAHNTQRTENKKELVPTKEEGAESIRLMRHASDLDEAGAVAGEIASYGQEVWGQIAILGRSRAILAHVLKALTDRGVSATMIQRRDRFVSAQFVWLQKCLDQVVRAGDRRVFVSMVDAANRFCEAKLEGSLLTAEAEAAGLSYLQHWSAQAEASEDVVLRRLGSFAADLLKSRLNWRRATKNLIESLAACMQTDDVSDDFVEDQAAWVALDRQFLSQGGVDLAQFVQEVALSPKEAPSNSKAVSLFTIHGSKGLEFEIVYVVGLAERVLPSWQSMKEGDNSSEMEEERRNCFVAITRTKSKLILSWADAYAGYERKPSRFLKEMRLVE